VLSPTLFPLRFAQTEIETGNTILAFVVAAGLGAIIGLERQAQEDSTEDPYAGVRTFALYSIWGAGAGFLGDRFGETAFISSTIGFFALLVTAYAISSRTTGDWGTTTDAASATAFLIGTLVWSEAHIPALALAIGTAALLRAKKPLHILSQHFTTEDIQAVLQFGVITAIALPLAPDENIGPLEAINLHEIWLMVVLVSGIGLAGYLALRLLGPQGLIPTGLFGGLVSSTAVTLSFSRLSKTAAQHLHYDLAAGIIAASGLMYARVIVEAALVAPKMAEHLLPILLPLFFFVEGAAVFAWRKKQNSATTPSNTDTNLPLTNPLTLTTALGFALFYGVIIFISEGLLDNLSDSSLSILGAVSGLNDVDAITLSSANLVDKGLAPSAGARAALAAVITNSLTKAGITFALGERKLARLVMRPLLAAAAVGTVTWFFI